MQCYTAVVEYVSIAEEWARRPLFLYVALRNLVC